MHPLHYSGLIFCVIIAKILEKILYEIHRSLKNVMTNYRYFLSETIFDSYNVLGRYLLFYY